MFFFSNVASCRDTARATWWGWMCRRGSPWTPKWRECSKTTTASRGKSSRLRECITIILYCTVLYRSWEGLFSPMECSTVTASRGKSSPLRECARKEKIYILLCTVLCCTVLYCFALYCTVVYCLAVYCTVLYCSGYGKRFLSLPFASTSCWLLCLALHFMLLVLLFCTCPWSGFPFFQPCHCVTTAAGGEALRAGRNMRKG